MYPPIFLMKTFLLKMSHLRKNVVLQNACQFTYYYLLVYRIDTPEGNHGSGNGV